jgi:predicted Zn-ribbon and HTH transcriptional regulator
MIKNTVQEAIIEVLNSVNRPLSVKEIYEIISERNLYRFKSSSPTSIINSELRKKSQGIELMKSSAKKYFKYVDGKYKLLQ